MCSCVDSCLSVVLEESVDHAIDGIQTPDEFFDQQESKLFWSTHLFRALGIVTSVIGLWLIFTPVILTFKWIPLIG